MCQCVWGVGGGGGQAGVCVYVSERVSVCVFAVPSILIFSSSFCFG